MKPSRYAIGQAVFIRTDRPDYAEVTVPFASLAELVKVCATPRPRRTLEKVIVYSMLDKSPCALTLGFISCSKGERPGAEQIAHD